MGGDHTSWSRETGIERYAKGKPLCVVMPAVDISFYADMVHGNKYFTYLTQELPQILSAMLPISTKGKDNYVAGFSMGGYGALKVALNYPEQYNMAASLAGAVDMKAIYDYAIDNDEKAVEIYNTIYGGEDAFLESIDDLRYMVRKRKEEKNLPALYIGCGTEDFLYEVNKGYVAYLDELDIPFTYEEEAGSGHTWKYCDSKIQRVLEWMGL